MYNNRRIDRFYRPVDYLVDDTFYIKGTPCALYLTLCLDFVRITLKYMYKLFTLQTLFILLLVLGVISCQLCETGCQLALLTLELGRLVAWTDQAGSFLHLKSIAWLEAYFRHLVRPLSTPQVWSWVQAIG